MKSVDELLGELKAEIDKGYQATTMVNALAGRVYLYLDKLPQTLLKINRLPIIEPYGELSKNSVNATLRDVEPSDIGFIVNLNGLLDDADAYLVTSVWQQLGKQLADKEYQVIINGALGYAGTTINSKQNGELSKEDVNEAQGKIQDAYGDCLIISPKQHGDFLKKNLILPPTRLPTEFVPEIQRGYYYVGMMNGANVYVSSFLKDIAVVFSRNEMTFASTKLKVTFDRTIFPKQLILRKSCVSAPLFDGSVCRIQL
jgi:hypothetical protein